MPQRFSRQCKAAHIPVVIFGRQPRVGVGKTRLARDVGVITAWRFQRDCLAHSKQRLAARTCLTPDGTGALPQGKGPLGTRLLRLMRRGPMIIIGSDVPGLTNTDIAVARQALTRPGLVVGPSPDGGFWLIGWRGDRLPAGLFKGVRWSSRHTLADLQRNAAENSLHLRLIHSRADVDHGVDLRAAQRRRLTGQVVAGNS